MKIYVTGIGVISAIGLNAAENLHSLEHELTGIKKLEVLNQMIGEVKLSNEEIIKQLQLDKSDYSRTTLLSLIAAMEAWSKNKHFKNVRTGLISSTSIGGIDRTEKYYFIDQKENTATKYHLMTHDNGRTTESVAQILGISGYIGTISTACSSGANAVMQGARLIQSKKLDRVIVGGADPIAIFNEKGFSSLNVYDKEICKPFDDNRKGLNLGEGAGFLILENEHSLSITGNTPICLLAGWDNATDAYHQTASSPTGKGAAIAMTNALQKANLKPENIDYINAHGTGTGNNDLSESVALQKVFNNKMPPFSSTKGFTGHTLAAAGAIEAVYCVQAIKSNSVLPNLNFSTPMKETGMIPATKFRTDVNIRNVLSNSFGFGGNCSSLIFTKD
jgi:3-oxoacyl-(acyl-carrier-protein) synthase